MPKEERSWEHRYEPDGEVSWSATVAIGFAFVLIEVLAMVGVGFNVRGLIVGAIIGIVVIVALSKLVVRSQRRVRQSPPPDLL
jgi:hypothetical protein